MVEFVKNNPWIMVLLRVGIIALFTYAAVRISKKLWRKNPDNNNFLIRKFVYNIVHAVIYIIGLLLAIGQIPQLSQVVQTILAGSGILALAVSLSAQESLGNVISGLFITIFKPFEVGNRVTLVSNSITGTIEDITLRHTIIKTFTNTRIVVPNSKMNQEILENSQLIDSRASSFLDVSVAYEADLDKAIAIMAEVIGSHPLYWDVRTEEQKQSAPKVRVYVRELGASGVSLRANMWTRTVDENFAACSDVRLQLKKAFDAAGIEIPYTKYTILRQEPRLTKNVAHKKREN